MTTVAIFGNGPSALQYHDEGMKADLVVACNYGQKGLKADIYFIQDSETIFGWAERGSEPDCKTVYLSRQAHSFYNNLVWREKIKPWASKIELFEEVYWPFTSSGLHAFLNLNKYCPSAKEVILIGMDCLTDDKTYRSLSSAEKREDTWMLSTWVKNWETALAMYPDLNVNILLGEK